MAAEQIRLTEGRFSSLGLFCGLFCFSKQQKNTVIHRKNSPLTHQTTKSLVIVAR